MAEFHCIGTSSVVDALTRWLDAAMKGEVDAVCIVGLYADGDIGFSNISDSAASPHKMLGAIDDAKFRLLQRMND